MNKRSELSSSVLLSAVTDTVLQTRPRPTGDALQSAPALAARNLGCEGFQAMHPRMVGSRPARVPAC